MNPIQQVDPTQVPAEGDNLRYTKMSLIDGSGVIPALGFGTLIPNPIDTIKATRAALEAGFRQLDSAERYRNEKEVYLRQKVVVVDQAPRQNAAKAFLAALRDDWKPKIQTVKLGIPARCL